MDNPWCTWSVGRAVSRTASPEATALPRGTGGFVGWGRVRELVIEHRRWGMDREALQVALAYLQRKRPWAESAEEVSQMHTGLQTRLGCPMTVEEAMVCWECFSTALYAQRWVVVDDGFLNLCAAMLQAASRSEEPWGRQQDLQTSGANAVAQSWTSGEAGG